MDNGIPSKLDKNNVKVAPKRIITTAFTCKRSEGMIPLLMVLATSPPPIVAPKKAKWQLVVKLFVYC